jgi:pSer/pThr/pTyr-binding forkhead associated (FHA) protein
MSTIAPQAPQAPRSGVISPAKPAVVGRSPESDFVIDDRTVSRRHAAIHREGYLWIVEDLGSKNGTRVNGKPVRRGALVPGDEIGFGAATARFDPDERRLFSELRVEEPVGGT